MKKILIIGSKGMVGKQLLNHFSRNKSNEVIGSSRNDTDLLDEDQVVKLISSNNWNVVILAAAKVGGIGANIKDPVSFLEENLRIQNNVISTAHKMNVPRLVFLGSSCIYPRNCEQPIRETSLLTGELEPTNEGYAIAKIAGLRLTQYYARVNNLDWICPMPCNLYGPEDCFDLEKSHVLSALVKRFCDAKKRGDNLVKLWGTGNSRREFLHVKDLACAVELLLEKWHSPEIINVGSGFDISISELAYKISCVVGFEGKIEWDSSKPDGMPKKCLDISKISSIGFKSSISLENGISELVENYKKNKYNE